MIYPVTPTLRLDTDSTCASVERGRGSSPLEPRASNDTAAPLGVNETCEPSVILATFPDAILLKIEGDDDLSAEWRRLYPLYQRTQAEDAAYQLAEFYGLPLRSDDCTHVQVTHG